MGCVALCRVVIENDTYEDVTVLKVGDLLVGGVFFLLARILCAKSVHRSVMVNIMVWTLHTKFSSFFLYQVNSGSTDM